MNSDLKSALNAIQDPGGASPLTADLLKQHLNLQPHPREGGFFVRTYESEEITQQSALPDRYAGARHAATCIYYLLEPGTFSEIHRLASDEIYHFYLGDPIELLELPDGEPGHIVTIGPDILNGQRVQYVLRNGVWQGSRLVPGGRFALIGCTVSPGFDFKDYEDVDRATLIARWPQWTDRITALTHR